MKAREACIHLLSIRKRPRVLRKQVRVRVKMKNGKKLPMRSLEKLFS
jgi:hypothetical protein